MGNHNLKKNSGAWLICDDHPLVCSGVKGVISELGLSNEIITTTHSKEALNILKTVNIDLLILDINLSDCDGYAFYQRLKSHGYSGKVIFYSAESCLMYSQMALQLGADGYVCKSESCEILKDAVDIVLKGYSFFKFKQETKNRNDLPALSNRENSVMRLLTQGKDNKEIAEILSISNKTVSTYKRRIFSKFNIKNTLELTRLLNKDLDSNQM